MGVYAAATGGVRGPGSVNGGFSEMRTGLTSITFRQLNCAEIVELVRQAGLDGIEWGGDIHVPPGQLEAAREARRLTEDAGLVCSSYGSYYRLGDDRPQQPFEMVLDTAEALGVAMVRIWPGSQGSEQAGAVYRRLVAQEAHDAGTMAAARGMQVAFEFHGGSLTDTAESAVELLESVNHPAVGTYWQPPLPLAVEKRCEGLQLLMPWVRNVHVFQWTGPHNERLALSAGVEAWTRYLEVLGTTERDGFLLIEYVRDDAPEAFLEDARVLGEWSKSQ